MWARVSYLLKANWFLFAVAAMLLPVSAHATDIRNYSDTISDSAPGEYSNHTIQFKTIASIPPGGYVRFVLDPDDFTIPAVHFDIDNVQLLVSTSSGYTLRSATNTPTAMDDGVTITPGTTGDIEITLNSTEGIPADATVRLKIGNHTTNATTTDLGILNPGATGAFSYRIETGGDGNDSIARGLVAIIDSVTIPGLDTTETEAPVRFNGAPSSTLSGTSITVQISLETNEFARCRYTNASGTPYHLMGNEFNSWYTTVHTENISVTPNTTYTFYVRCIDDEGNENTDDYIISFTIPAQPVGEPGPEGEREDTGSGGGEGSGDSSSGAGDPSGSDDTSGGTSGGGGGGGSGGGSGPSTGGSGGGGGFEGTDKPYQSGDGLVIITGYAFPQSRVTILVDGKIAREVIATSNGSFSLNMEEIARGVYTFGVYATDKNGTKSSTYSTTFSVTGSRGSTLSNVNVMPSIKVTPDPVDPGSTVTFSGYAIPNSVVTIENQNDKSSVSLKTFTANSNASGAWSLEVSTDGFQTGTYKVRAKAKQESTGVSTNFSGFTYYGVGEQAKVARTSDLNRDGKVNLTDFSILLYWWNSDGGNSNPPADINADGRVSLTDFSIMVFNWTG